jgi:hypothetical protein
MIGKRYGPIDNDTEKKVNGKHYKNKTGDHGKWRKQLVLR